MIGRFPCGLADLYMLASCTTPPAWPRPAIALKRSVPSFSDSTMRSRATVSARSPSDFTIWSFTGSFAVV